MYNVGQRVNLWNVEIDTEARRTRILKSVIVTITDIKTGVPGDYSRRPSSFASLRGLGDDGKVYEKHWDYWPESQTNCFLGSWSPRADGVKRDFWIPQEAASAYNSFVHEGKHKFNMVDRIVDADGNDIIPQGDVAYCVLHDEYFHNGSHCSACLLEEMRKKRHATEVAAS